MIRKPNINPNISSPLNLHRYADVSNVPSLLTQSSYESCTIKIWNTIKRLASTETINNLEDLIFRG